MHGCNQPYSCLSSFSLRFICDNLALPVPCHWERINTDEPYQVSKVTTDVKDVREKLWHRHIVFHYTSIHLLWHYSLSSSEETHTSLKRSPDCMRELWTIPSNVYRGSRTWTYGNSSAGMKITNASRRFCCWFSYFYAKSWTYINVWM